MKLVSLLLFQNLALDLCKPFHGVLNKVFPKCSTKEEVSNGIRNE